MPRKIFDERHKLRLTELLNDGSILIGAIDNVLKRKMFGCTKVFDNSLKII